MPDLGGRDDGGGGMVSVPLGSVGRGSVDDVGHGSPRRDSPTREVLFTEVFSLSFHICYEGQPPIILDLAASQG